MTYLDRSRSNFLLTSWEKDSFWNCVCNKQIWVVSDDLSRMQVKSGDDFQCGWKYKSAGVICQIRVTWHIWTYGAKARVIKCDNLVYKMASSYHFYSEKTLVQIPHRDLWRNSMRNDFFDQKKLYKNYTKRIQKLYIFIDKLYKTCIKCKLKKVETWNACFWYIQTMYKLCKTYTAG